MHRSDIFGLVIVLTQLQSAFIAPKLPPLHHHVKLKQHTILFLKVVDAITSVSVPTMLWCAFIFYKPTSTKAKRHLQVVERRK